MTSIPLAAFLLELSTDGFHLTVQDYQRIGLALQTGGQWTIIRLRGVLNALLAKDPEQSICFLRRFDDFFDLTMRNKSGKQSIDVNAILTEVKQLQNNEIPQSIAKEQAKKRTLSIKPEQTATPKSPKAWYLSFPVILPTAGLLLLISYFFIQLLSPPAATPNPTPIKPATTSVPKKQAAKESTPTEPAQRVYSNVPVVKKITRTPIKGRGDWKYSIAIALGFLVITGFYAVYIWLSRKTPKDKGDKWDSTQPRHFAKEQIGGKPAPRLNPETLAHLADSMGYFQSEQISSQLDVLASVSATMDKGGIPALHFDKRRQLRQLIILVDRFAEALAWNPIATELEQGLSLLGVPLLYGQFRGAPDEILTEDGNTIYLDDLDTNRNGYLLLIFSDGKGLRPHHRQLLEAINRWPMKAWMELRTKEFWDESAALPARYGIDLYPASADGLLSAFGAFLTEKGAEKESKEQVISNTTATEGDLHHKLETLLADTLPLAQACAMMQPITLGMVDALRREFYPNLAVESVERLIAIPGTTRTATGLQFNDSVLAILRADFAIRRTEPEQEQVLHFLLRHIDAVEPATKDSPAHLSWQLTKTRIQLELTPDQALKRLSELSQSPLHNTIQAELEKVVEPGQTTQADNKDFLPIPLRKATTTPDGRQRLGQLAKNSGIATLESYPVAKKHWVGLSVFILIVVVFFGQAWERYNTFIGRMANIRVVDSEPSLYDTRYKLEQKGVNGWESTLGVTFNTSKILTLKEDFIPVNEYRLALSDGDNIQTEKLGVVEEDIEITLGKKTIKHPCRQNRPEFSLTLFRCPPSLMLGQSEFSKNSWTERIIGERLSSVGIDFSPQIKLTANAKPSAIGTQLLHSGSIDLLIHFSLEPNEKNVINSIRFMIQELAPWTLKDVQLIIISPTNLSPDLQKYYESLTRVVTLNTQRDRANIEKLLAPGTQSYIPEEEILAVIPQASISGVLPRIVLTRPLTLGYLTVTTTTKNIPISANLRLSRRSETSEINEKSDKTMEIPTGKWQIQAVASAGLRSKWIPVEIVAGEYQRISLDLAPVELEVQALEGYIKLEALREMEGLGEHVQLVAFSPDSKTLASVSTDLTIKLWDITNGWLKATLFGHTDDVNSIKFSPNGKFLVSGSSDKTIRVWDLQTEEVIHTLTNNTGINLIAFSPNGKILASSGSGSIQLWDVATWQNISRLSDNTEECSSPEFSSDEKHLVASCGSVYKIWDLPTGKLTQTVQLGSGDIGKSIAISSDAQIVAMSTNPNPFLHAGYPIKLWKLTLNLEISTIVINNSILSEIAFSADNKILAVGGTVDSLNGNMSLFDVASGIEIQKIEPKEWINTVAFSPDGQILVSGDYSGAVQLWQMYPKYTTPVWEAETKTGDQQ